MSRAKPPEDSVRNRFDLRGSAFLSGYVRNKDWQSRCPLQWERIITFAYYSSGSFGTI